MQRAIFMGSDPAGILKRSKTYKLRVVFQRELVPPIFEFELNELKPYVYVYDLEEEHPDMYCRVQQYESFNEVLLNWSLK